jgi:hypothetical protein
MSKKLMALAVISVFIAGILAPSCFADESNSEILEQGLLGAGAGAVGGAVSGGKGGDLWKGALAGAGVNVVGGALLDAISGEHVQNTNDVQQMQPVDAFSQGYQQGYQNGYKTGFNSGYQESEQGE